MSSLAETPQINVMTEPSNAGATASVVTNTDDGDTVGGADSNADSWMATPEWVDSWKKKLPLQTIMRVLQILVPQVEKICIDKLAFFFSSLSCKYCKKIHK